MLAFMLWKAVFLMLKTTIWFGWLILPIDLETQIASSHKFFPMRLLDPFLFTLTSARTHTHVYMTLLPSFVFLKNTVPWGPAVPRGPLRLVRDMCHFVLVHNYLYPNLPPSFFSFLTSPRDWPLHRPAPSSPSCWHTGHSNC